MDDFNSQNLQSTFKTPSSLQNLKSGTAQNQQHEDGELESKETTVPHSKTKLYEQSDELQSNENNIDLTHKNLQSNNVQQHAPILGQPPNGNTQNLNNQMAVQMTEKKLNNYLQQAKFLISSNDGGKVPKLINSNITQKPSIIKSYSIDQNDQLESEGVRKSVISHKHNLSSQNNQIKVNNFEGSDRNPLALLKKKEESPKRRYYLNDKKAIKESQNHKNMPQKYRSSEIKISERYTASNQEGFESARSITNNKINEQNNNSNSNRLKMIQDIDQIYTEQEVEETEPNQQENQQQEMILTIQHDSFEHKRNKSKESQREEKKDISKRKKSMIEQSTFINKTYNTQNSFTSRSIVNQPINTTQGSVSILDQQKSSIASKGSNQINFIHKKTTSHLPQSLNNTSRSSQLQTKKHTTATTSPHERVIIQSQQVDQTKLQHILKQKTQTIQTSSSRNSLLIKQLATSKTLAIKEEFNEAYGDDEEEKRADNLVSTLQEQQQQPISPSNQSQFKFQPKFFKPNNMAIHNTGKQSLSMEDCLTTSTLHSQKNVFKKGISKNM